jgi:acetolactate synthase-1/2/3 large subunit
MSHADVILVVGARFNFVLAYGQPPRFNASARVIQIDIDPAEIGRNRDVEIGIAGDAGAVLRQLNQRIAEGFESAQEPAWRESLAQRDASGQARFAEALASGATPIHPLRLCDEVRRYLDRDATVIADGGDILSFARLAMDSHEPGRWMDAGTFGCLGEGLGFAMAAKLARPHSQVVALIGDGAFGLNAMEMDTAARYGIPIVVVVSNNAAWNIEKQTQILEFGRPHATDLNPTRYDRLAEVLGCYAEHVERPEDIRPALERAFSSGRPALLNVVTDPNAISPDAVRMLGAVPAKQAVQYQ